MDFDLSKELRALFAAGVGAAAITVEKAQELLKVLVEKGEVTIEQGKTINEELKRNFKQAVKDNVTVNITPESGDELIELVDKLSPEQRAALKAKLSEMDADKPEEAGE